MEVQGKEGTDQAVAAINQLDTSTKKTTVSTNELTSSTHSYVRAANIAQNTFFRGAMLVSRFAGANKQLADAIFIAGFAADAAIGSINAYMAVSRAATTVAHQRTVAEVGAWTAASGGLAVPLLLAALSAATIGAAVILSQNAPKLASGGIVSAPTMFMAGEAGKERIRVEPLDREMGMDSHAPVIIEGRNIRDALQKQSIVDWYAGRA